MKTTTFEQKAIGYLIDVIFEYDDINLYDIVHELEFDMYYEESLATLNKYHHDVIYYYNQFVIYFGYVELKSITDMVNKALYQAIFETLDNDLLDMTVRDSNVHYIVEKLEEVE